MWFFHAKLYMTNNSNNTRSFDLNLSGRKIQPQNKKAMFSQNLLHQTKRISTKTRRMMKLPIVSNIIEDESEMQAITQPVLSKTPKDVKQTALSLKIDNLENTSTREKKKKLKQVTTTPITHEIFVNLLQRNKPLREQMLCFSRFRVAISLLYITGKRINEIRTWTRATVESYLCRKNNTEFLEPSELYSPFFEKQAEKLWPIIEPDVREVFAEDEQLGGQLKELSWIIFINKRIKKYSKREDLTSHSFRTYYIAKLLEENTLEKTSKIIGHQDWRTTSGYLTKDPKRQQKLDAAFECLLNTNQNPK